LIPQHLEWKTVAVEVQTTFRVTTALIDGLPNVPVSASFPIVAPPILKSQK